MALGREIVGAADDVVDHRAVPRLAHAHGDRLAPAHVDRLLAHGERARPVGRDVAVGIGRIDALDEQVLAVEVGGGEAPADRAVVAQHDGRRAGRGGAADVEARPDQPCQVPGAGKAQREMRIVGEQGLVRHRMGARQHPFVRGLALARGDVVGLAIEPVEVGALQGLVGHRERGVLIVAHRFDQEFHRIGADLAREPEPQQLGAPVAVEAERHQLGPHQQIGRPPRLGLVGAARQQLDQGELEAELLVVVGDPGVHAGGIGVDDGAHGGRQCVQALGRAAIDAKPAHGAVGVDQARADQPRRQQLRQPALAEPAQELHLPEAVLGMDVAQAERGILDRARDDVRHGVLVAQDLDRRLEARGFDMAGCTAAAPRAPGRRRRSGTPGSQGRCRPRTSRGRRRTRINRRKIKLLPDRAADLLRAHERAGCARSGRP